MQTDKAKVSCYIPKSTRREFMIACKLLEITASNVFREAVDETISRAQMVYGIAIFDNIATTGYPQAEMEG